MKVHKFRIEIDFLILKWTIQTIILEYIWK